MVTDTITVQLPESWPENTVIELAIGALAGAIVGVWFDVVAVIVFLGLRKRPGSWVARTWGDRPALVLISPVLFFHSLWMLAGVFIGLLLWLVSGKGSPEVSRTFVWGIVAVSVIGIVLAMRNGGQFRRWLLSFVLVFFLAFGVLLPFMAAGAH